MQTKVGLFIPSAIYTPHEGRAEKAVFIGTRLRAILSTPYSHTHIRALVASPFTTLRTSWLFHNGAGDSYDDGNAADDVWPERGQ